MGAPNVVRGKSHSGNISAADVAASGHLDVLSSDYVPSSLLPAVFRLAETVPGMSLPKAMRMITLNPAHAAGLEIAAPSSRTAGPISCRCGLRTASRRCAACGAKA